MLGGILVVVFVWGVGGGGWGEGGAGGRGMMLIWDLRGKQISVEKV